MRALLMTLITLSFIPGCLYGANRGETIVTHETVNPDGTVKRESYTTQSNGANVGASITPGMFGALAMNGGGLYGGAAMVGGMYGGGNTACVLHPDRCAALQVATVIQPISISSSGGGNVVVARGGSARSVPSGGGIDTDDAALTAMLAKHEKALASVVPGTRQNSRQICQILVANPEAITDEDERKLVIADCKAALAKHPYTKTAQKEDK